MTLFTSHISVAQAATGINAAVTTVQVTLPASFAVVLFFLLPKSNSALGWSAVTRMLHSSIWPTLLFSDSSQSNHAGTAIATLSYLSTLSTVLVAIVGVTLPLGLAPGPLMPTQPQVQVPANYVTDTSPLSLATTANLESFLYGRVCYNSTRIGLVLCPGKDSDPTMNTTYPPTLIGTFNSSQHSPFTMQYRRTFRSNAQVNISSGILGTPQSLLLRDGVFIVEGLVVDMTPGNYGIGFWNNTLPDTPNGGVWSQDILWLEPVTECVDTNLTVEYTQMGNENPVDNASLSPLNGTSNFNFTDHGGFHSLTRAVPLLMNSSQQVDLASRAFRGAVLSNMYTMEYLNATRESSFEGKSYRLGVGGDMEKNIEIAHILLAIGRYSVVPLRYINSTESVADGAFACSGFDPMLDTASLVTPSVTCAAFLGPPLRSDGGDPRIFDVGLGWSQRIHVCASATRASIHEVTFSVNKSKTVLQDFQVTHRPSQSPALWGVEKANRTISGIDLLWGRVDDRYEGDSDHLWTLRNEYLYLPAGASGTGSTYFALGQPHSASNVIWQAAYDASTRGEMTSHMDSVMDYSGASNYATRMKLQSLVQDDLVLGNAHIRNAIWTDMMANNVVGTASSPTLLISPYQPTLEYDFRFAIPAFFLIFLWTPPFLASLYLLITQTIDFRYMKRVLNHTSVGRVVVGTAKLRVEGREGGTLADILSGKEHDSRLDLNSSDSLVKVTEGIANHQKKDWASRFGAIPVSLDLDRLRPRQKRASASEEQDTFLSGV
ncbi:hypothetical protein D9756_006370 [Leucocoprinus leucothites]|uniref:Uncharacterized protein n=1 Tax=Leucocoprinus leucothites TaxID=201217 RepID=A0A8H5LH54_9AGAR|nr:hypothetical protein D9756_006370 [Leucoagaricus leucothites]